MALKRAVLAVLVSAALSVALSLTPAEDARAYQIGLNLRCPVCTGLPITESGNDLSVQMLREVREQVQAGRSDRQIYDFFAARYGNVVLLKPPRQGLNLLLWGTPLLALLAGGGLLWRTLSRRPDRQRVHPLPDGADAYLTQVRRETRSNQSGDLSPGRRSVEGLTDGVQDEDLR